MFEREDRTFREIQERSLEQWLSQMENHPDVVVRGGVPLTRNYIEYLQKEIRNLQETNHLKDAYLKKLSSKNKN